MISKANLILFKESGLELAQAQLSSLERLQEKLLGGTPSMRGKPTIVIHTTIEELIKERKVFIIFHLLYLNGVDADAIMLTDYLDQHPEVS